MTQDQEKIQEVLQKIEMTDIIFALSQLAGKVISGLPIENKDYQIKLSVPKEVADVLEKVANAGEVPIEDILSSLASQGLNSSLNGYKQEAAASTAPPPVQENIPDPAEQLKALGFDMTALTSKLGQLGGLAEQLEGMQKVFENAEQSNQDTNQKDNK